MSDRQLRKLVAVVLIVLSVGLVLWVFGMWMMPSMMGGGMMGEMMEWSNGYMGLYTFGPLLLAAVLVVLAVVLLRRSGVRNGEKR
jgi:hypothetical protein